MTFAYGEVAYGELPSIYDHSAVDPFAALLNTSNPQLMYLIELYPYDATVTQSLAFPLPYGAAAYGEFEITYFGGINKTYLSDTGFITEPSDTPSSQYFIAQVDNPLQYETSILSGDHFGSGNQSFGSIIITNGNGRLDYLNDYSWSNRRVVIKAGTKGFTYSQFSTVFDGAANGIEGDDERITITVRDNRVKTDQLLVPNIYAGTGGLEGGTDIANKPKPLCYGVVNNIEPVLVDAVNLIYQIHDGSINYVTEVRDSGVEILNAGDVSDIQAASVAAGYFKTDLSKGYIKLGSTPAGRITADAQGENGYSGYVFKVGDIVKRIVQTRLGSASLNDTDIDGGSLNRLSLAIPGPVGIFINDRISASAVIDDLVTPLGAYWTFTRQGQLLADVIDQPGTETYTIDADTIDESGIRITNTIAPAWRISVGYAPAFIVQNSDELSAGTSAIDRAFVSEEYRYVSGQDEVVRSQNTQAVELVFKTKLALKADAEALLARLQRIYSKKRRIIQVPIYGALFRLYIGSTVKLVYGRFGLSSGSNFLISSIGEDAETGLTTLDLWG
ncbi:hypothetical protein [Dyadobacter sp. CY323]|uniref:hypothetical protein n=1 Tax=Dyadobacter sp. CY323 TaxID=2907302 RepID=UPI001F2788F9|nr:hypothetical protein [Dyadobacter sp. CY323]MCE6993051.1 hypothetical protein [Dyadobacter sp. CY323]